MSYIFFQEARTVAVQCLELLKSTNYNLRIEYQKLNVSSLINIGICKLDLLEIADAGQSLNTAIILCQNNVLERYLINCYFGLAFLNSCLGNKEKAYYFARKTQDMIMVEKINSWVKGYSLLFLGLTYKNLHEKEKAFEMYSRAIFYAKESNYTQVRAKALTGLAELYQIKGAFEKALSNHSESIELREQIGAKCDLAEAYYQLGLTYQKMGKTENSNTSFDEAIRLFNEMEAPKQVEKVEKAKRVNY